MIKLRKIGGAFMLLVILAMMAHNTFPHVHHQHESHSHDSNEKDHHSHQDEDHHQEKQDSSSHNPLDFISFLLGNHSHSQQVVDNTLIVEQSVKEKGQKKVAKIYLDKAEVRNLPEAKVHSKSPAIYFELGILNFYTITSPLRGPPALG